MLQHSIAVTKSTERLRGSNHISPAEGCGAAESPLMEAFASGSQGVVNERSRPNALETSSYLSSSTKRAFDVTGGLILLLFFAIVLLAFGLVIVCTSRGSALFVQKRYGRHGTVFPIYKLRSMRAAPASTEFKQAEKGDARVTTVGRFIRKTSIDELPQLLNVVKGEMSLVGPRPHPIALDDLYSPSIEDFHRRFDAAPGMTGLAQVSRARGETPTVEHMRKRVEFDLAYVQRASLWLDIKILLLTAREVFFSPTRNEVF